MRIINQKSKNKVLFLTIVVLLLLVAVIRPQVCEAAGGHVVTDVKIARGDDAVSQLEEEGYYVKAQNLNSSDKRDKAIYLGYKTGDKKDGAVTNLIVSGKNQDTIIVDGISYKKASSANLNTGTDGDSLYLYYTKDSKAGSAIIDFETNVYRANGDKKKKGYPLKNDGSSPVRKDDKTAANFEQGKKETYIYIMMIRDNVYQPYIGEVHMACASSVREAINKLSGLGCNYYLDYEFDTLNRKMIMMVGYNRTDTASEAITTIVGMDKDNAVLTQGMGLVLNDVEYEAVDPDEWENYGYGFFLTRDSRAGNPIYDIQASDVDGMEMSLKEWASGLYAMNSNSLAASYMATEDTYLAASQDEGTMLHTISMMVSEAGAKARGEVVFLREVTDAVNSPWAAEEQELVLTEEASTETGLPSDMMFEEEGDMDEELLEEDITYEEVELEDMDPNQVDIPEDILYEDTEEEEMQTGSVFGNSSVAVVGGLGLFALLAGLVFFLYKKNIQKKENPVKDFTEKDKIEKDIKEKTEKDSKEKDKTEKKKSRKNRQKGDEDK